MNKSQSKHRHQYRFSALKWSSVRTRNRKTNYILLGLAFVFALTIIILATVPANGSQSPQTEELSAEREREDLIIPKRSDKLREIEKTSTIPNYEFVTRKTVQTSTTYDKPLQTKDTNIYFKSNDSTSSPTIIVDKTLTTNIIPKLNVTTSNDDRMRIVEDIDSISSSNITKPLIKMVTNTSCLSSSSGVPMACTNNTVESTNVRKTVIPLDRKSFFLFKNKKVTGKDNGSNQIYKGKNVKLLTGTNVQPHHTVGTSNYCETDECHTVSSNILGLMDHTTGPCKDFYKYACGGRKTPRDTDVVTEINERILGSLEKNNEQSPIKTFYNFCIDFMVYSKNNPSSQLIKNSTTSIFNTLENSIDNDDITDILVNFMKANYNPLLDITVGLDSTTGDFLPMIQPPIKTNIFGELPDRIYCIDKLSHIGNGDLLQEYYNRCMKTEGLAVRMGIIEEALIYFNVNFDTNVIEELKEFLHESSFSKYHNQTRVKKAVNSFQESGEERDVAKLLSVVTYGNETKNISEFITPGLDFADEIVKEIRYIWTGNQDNKRGFLKMLWAERLFVTLVRPMTVLSPKIYCLETLKELLPLETSYLLYSSFKHTEIESVKEAIEEITGMNSSIFKDIHWDTAIMGDHYDFIEKVILGDDYSESAFLLGERLRKMAYSLIGENSTTPLARYFLFSHTGDKSLVSSDANENFISMQKLLPFHYMNLNHKPFLQLKVGTLLSKLKLSNTKSPCEQTGTELQFMNNNKSLNLQIDGDSLQNKLTIEVKTLENIVHEFPKHLKGFSEDMIWLGPAPLKSNKVIVLAYVQMQCMQAGDKLKDLLNGDMIPNYLWINEAFSNSKEISKIFECPFISENKTCPLPLESPIFFTHRAN